ncbi:PREDICTED: E3 ubiquitin/ISG15 ligase TRIM25-like [Poecilia mexicana]|uniref:B30.2/SPRY domain-containing protein n=1 Tax=Poecilia mexicana TaxID=48701 RepID=A0A3B3WS09_9TELE|nr:PREDICTED: E3 ubiquitin/ISG15 ligase TRIM25-like [Poecilia mexicana]XP_014863071.1 PREDICTED: E3 ubiquitin/ISG15 ligase TRIM25-like [Poecilia mexicana]XP_014863072.1 PREDICTED: E3 ubiquitin/ISG15 ligase TRIM25-like [Poecilia mexicana]XP_014863073.1 PREDICTED: E3 ubiquitin/ISG15 ligase TRIM25-like [Poecilia mexicana]
MSVPKEPPAVKRPEAREDDDIEPEEPKGKDEQGKDFPKTTQTAKPAFNPLTLIKDDFNQFKEEMKKMFKDKDLDPKPSQSAEKSSSPLTVLKEELSNVFRFGPSRGREDKNVEKKEDSRNNPRTKASRAERPEETLTSLFRREKPLLKTAQTNHTKEVKQSKETENTQESNDPINCLDKSSQMTGCGSEKRTEKTKTPKPQSEKLFASTAAPETSKTRIWENEEKEEEPLEKVLSSEVSLIPLRTNLSHQPTEDFWSLKNSAIYLTFDPNTANSELRLADGNRKASRDWLTGGRAEHPERFEQCPQVLCREGLLDSAYWEVSWSGGADIGVTYNNISRNGDTASCLLGHNERSWSLECSSGFYTPSHNNKRFQSCSPEPFSNRVGVYLNCPEGTLSFFCVSKDAMVHLHTFTSTFTEPLYPGFWVWASDGSVTLCQVELNWERLLK